MSPAERANACISVELESFDDEAVALGRQVERLWNEGQYDEALARVDYLSARVGSVAIGNSWRTPVPTIATGLWGRDVRIGNRDSLLELSFDVQDSSGHLFVALRHGSGLPHFSVCMSNDGGATWAETFTWSGSPPTSIDAAVLADYFYVAYNSPGENAQQVRLRRFLCSTGRADTFRNSGSWVAPCTLAAGDTMREVSFVSYRPQPNFQRLYMTTLVSDGSILWSWDDANAVSWITYSMVTSGASNGLCLTENLDCDSTNYFFCYYDVTDSLRIYGKSKLRFSLFTGRGAATSISAYGDTIICAYEDRTSSRHQVRYVINSGDGDTWRMGTLSDGDTTAESPGVTARRGGGIAAVFRHRAPTRELRFYRRAYSGPWSDPVSIAGMEPYWNRPGIEYLGAGVFGVAYLSNTSPVVRGAFFDRSDWVYGVADYQRPQAPNRTPMTTVVRGVLVLGAVDSRQQSADRAKLLDAAGRKVAELHPGANDVRALAPGVYFVRQASNMTHESSGVIKVVVQR